MKNSLRVGGLRHGLSSQLGVANYCGFITDHLIRSRASRPHFPIGICEPEHRVTEIFLTETRGCVSIAGSNDEFFAGLGYLCLILDFGEFLGKIADELWRERELLGSDLLH